MWCLLLISFSIYLLYNAIMLITFGIPVSLSETHYKLTDYNRKQEWVFTIALWLISIPILIYGLEITYSNYQFIIFITAAALCFVGAAPHFKSNKLENYVHTISAVICGLGSIIWSFIFGDWIINAASILLIGMFFLSKSHIRTFLIETILFLNLYLQLYLIIIDK